MRIRVDDSVLEYLLGKTVTKQVANFTRTQTLLFNVFKVVNIFALDKFHRENFLITQFFVHFGNFNLWVIFEQLPHESPIFLLYSKV